VLVFQQIYHHLTITIAHYRNVVIVTGLFSAVTSESVKNILNYFFVYPVVCWDGHKGRTKGIEGVREQAAGHKREEVTGGFGRLCM
jgi:hypothetical protein